MKLSPSTIVVLILAVCIAVFASRDPDPMEYHWNKPPHIVQTVYREYLTQRDIFELLGNRPSNKFNIDTNCIVIINPKDSSITITVGTTSCSIGRKRGMEGQIFKDALLYTYYKDDMGEAMYVRDKISGESTAMDEIDHSVLDTLQKTLSLRLGDLKKYLEEKGKTKNKKYTFIFFPLFTKDEGLL